MSGFEINDHKLQTECVALAKEIFDEARDAAGAEFDPEDARDEMNERAWETADGHEWIIYTYKALKMCAECDTTHGQEFLDDCGGVAGCESFDSAVAQIAFGEMLRRIESALSDLIDEYQDAGAC